jgi:hypothetical protein
LEEGVKVKVENLEWMLHNVFMYPRNHNTNESAKDAAKKYIVDSLQLTSGLDTSLQHFQPIQFLGLVRVNSPLYIYMHIYLYMNIISV